MQLPSIKKFLEIKSSQESLGPSKVPEMSKEDLGPKEVYISWEKTLSLTEKTVISKRFSRPAMIIGIFIGLLLLIMQEFVLILVIGSLIFFMQALTKMLPENERYEVSNHGIMIGDKIYYWDKLRRFFFIKSEGSEVIAIDTILGLPGRIYIHFNSSDKEKIKEVLDKYLHYLEEEPKTFLDKSYDKIVEKFNIDENAISQPKEITTPVKKKSVEEENSSKSE